MKMRRKAFFLLVFSLWTAPLAAGEVTVQSCNDGDTCAVQAAGLSFKVRLVGIDAPEKGRKKGSEQPFALEARDALNAMVKGKKVQALQYGIDAYNRPLVVFRLEQIPNVNETLVRLGLAEVYEQAENYDLANLRALQAQAKSARRGVWSLGAAYESPYLHRKKSRD